MHVVATAGHVDHGKSTLVRALTGTDPDQLPEERRRGLTIELGYCWTDLPGAGEVAFVDVPGHERFVPTMLAGVGPVPAVLFVVAADAPWMPQAAEHLAALDALGVRHCVLAVTRSDLADPGPVMRQALAELARTSLAGAHPVTVSARTGTGLEQVRAALVDMLAAVPLPDPGADVRYWIDRRFHVSGAGTVVTGTLPAGTIGVGDELQAGDTVVRVRAVQTLARPVTRASGVARVALNLAGPVSDRLGRGDALLTPGAWAATTTVDVRVGADVRDLPAHLQLHVGAAVTPTRLRPLEGTYARLLATDALPLRIGDRVLLRDPGTRRLWGATVLDPAPPALRRRGAAAARARELTAVGTVPDLASELRRRRVSRESLLRRLGVPAPDLDAHPLRAGDWLLDPDHARHLAGELTRQLHEWTAAHPLEQGLPLAAAAHALGLPDPQLVVPLVELTTPPLRLVAGRVVSPVAELPHWLVAALATLTADLTRRPFAAPEANRLTELGLDARALAAAVRAGRLWRVGDGIVLLPGADSLAVQRLSDLSQPFTTSQARVALETTRRVVLPLLEQLDRAGLTRRLPDDRRIVAGGPADTAPTVTTVHRPDAERRSRT